MAPDEAQKVKFYIIMLMNIIMIVIIATTAAIIIITHYTIQKPALSQIRILLLVYTLWENDAEKS